MEESNREEIWRKFTETIKSSKTRALYEQHLKSYMKFHKMQNPEELLKNNRKVIQNQIIDYIKARKQQGVAAQTISVEIAALAHFYTYNDYTEINWKIVRSFFGERVKTVKDRAYRIDELREMFQYATLRMRVVMLMLVSTGIRIGALQAMRVGDLNPIQNLYKIYVYPRTSDEYFTYCTPECRQYIDKYLDYRRSCGEKISAKSPLLRDEFDSEDPNSVNNPRFVNYGTLRVLMTAISKKAKVRTAPHSNNNAVRHGRTEIMIFHAMRKAYYRALNRADIKPEVREFLMGHKTGNSAMGVSNLMMIYDATEDNEALLAYLKAIPSLTIFEANVLKQELNEAKVKLSLEQEHRFKMQQEIIQQLEEELLRRIGHSVSQNTTTVVDSNRS